MIIVVIAIIAILASMLLPALNKARDRARSVKCANTAKQLGMYFALYTQNYGGWIPACTQSGADGKPNWTVSLINGFRSITRNDFVCPAVPVSSYGTGNYWFRAGDWKNNTHQVDWAYNINFAGPKNSGGSTGGGSSYQGSQPRQNAQNAARPSNIEAVPSYSAGDNDDFAVIDDSDDLPF